VVAHWTPIGRSRAMERTEEREKRDIGCV